MYHGGCRGFPWISLFFGTIDAQVHVWGTDKFGILPQWLGMVGNHTSTTGRHVIIGYCLGDLLLKDKHHITSPCRNFCREPQNHRKEFILQLITILYLELALAGMQLFKFPQWRHFIHFYPIAGKDRTVQPVEFSTAVAFSITSASTSRAPKSDIRDPQQQKWDPELGEHPTSRPQGPSRLQVFQGAELRFVFVSWTIFCICRGKRKRHTPCLPQPKKVGGHRGPSNPWHWGTTCNFSRQSFRNVAGHAEKNTIFFNLRSSQIWHLKQMQSCQVRFRLLYQLQCILRVCQLGLHSQLLCGRCLLF